MIRASYLTMPRWDRPFIILTDASEIAVAAVLVQEGTVEDSLHFLEFSSKKLTETQRRWSPTERELYAIVWACEKYEQFIKGGRPIIYSDHESLEHLINVNSPKIRRWAIRLSEFNPRIQYVKGSSNGLADWLSRISLEEESNNALIPDYCYIPAVYHMVHQFEEDYDLPTPQEMATESKEEESKLPPGTLDWNDGVAYRRISRRMYIPTKFRQRLLLWFHSSKYGGHQGITRTTKRMKKFVWWPNLQKDVQAFINSCPVCGTFKPKRSDGGVEGALNCSQLFHTISLDFIGPRKIHGVKFWILVIIDHYSRYMVAVPTEDTTTPFAQNTLQQRWVVYFGKPEKIIVDRGSQFLANSFKEYVTQKLKAKLIFTSPEYPQGNGINESSHRILETAIRTSVEINFADLAEVVADAVLLHNATPNRRLGDTPASLVFGADPRLPGLENFTTHEEEPGRLQILKDKRGGEYLIRQLRTMESNQHKAKGDQGQEDIDFKVGDLITYKLKVSERKQSEHVSGEEGYAAGRSLPYRVTKVTSTGVIAVPLWTSGPY